MARRRLDTPKSAIEMGRAPTAVETGTYFWMEAMLLE